ncbi:MAG: benzoyl-CoA-dihydrodiol lyase [Myxococcales bacterium]|nr:benzoyl-CoA-dihydrodiol lyase [Myxococcales bacterium]
MAESAIEHDPVNFETHPDRYKHWQLQVDGAVATLTLSVDLHGGLRPGYELKLNSYDLGVDIELADAVRRLRFEHPEVRVVVVTSGLPRVFCAGANIRMLASSAHGFKVNFCKFTNETRCEFEDMSANSEVHWIAAVNGACAGGGYELALACDEIFLVDDGSSTVSLPEVPLLGVLPGTGGLTRVVDKRKVRRDHADLFCTKAEGYRLRDAKKMKLVDDGFPRSKWQGNIEAKVAGALKARGGAQGRSGVSLQPVQPQITQEGQLTELTYEHVSLSIDGAKRVASLTLQGPKSTAPCSAKELYEQGDGAWALRAFRELDDALLQLRFNHPTEGLILLRTTGDSDAVLAWDSALSNMRDSGDWFAREVQLHQARVLRRLDNMARSMFALIEPGSCFAGVCYEIAMAADRSYMLDDPDQPNHIALHDVNFGAFVTHNGQTRMAIRYLGDPDQLAELQAHREQVEALEAEDLGLVTLSPDDLDWEDEVRIEIEERVSLSPDGLTGMEQNLRFAGAETCDTKIFGRLTAWQNWIFQRPNAVGDQGALARYGHPEKPVFDWKRT